MSRFLSCAYAGLEAYTPGEQPRDKAYIKLNTNESPFPPSERVVQALNADEVRDLRLYPDPDCRILKEKLAEAYALKAENVFVSNGSDDILNFAFMAFAKDRGAAFPDISYGFYRVYAELHGVKYVTVPLDGQFRILPEDYASMGRGLIAIANPNAPTGLALTLSQVESIVKSNPDSVVLIDEAYVDFGAESASGLVTKYDNLLVVHTYSKSASLAGARLGFALASRALIEDLERIKYSTNPYAINRLTLKAGVAVIEDAAYYRQNCRRITENRAYTIEALRELGFTVTDSMANFVFAKSDRIGGEALYRELRQRGILVRHFTAPRICEYNRITVGTRQDMEALVYAVRDILAK